MTPSRLVVAALSVVVLTAGLPVLAADAPDTVPAPAAGTEEAAPLFPDGPLFTPAPKPTAPECHFCASTLSTPTHWGHGATCTDAQNDVRAQLSAFVDAQCAQVGQFGRCAFSVVFTCACYFQEGQWVVDAYATYRCWMNYCEVN